MTYSSATRRAVLAAGVVVGLSVVAAGPGWTWASSPNVAPPVMPRPRTAPRQPPAQGAPPAPEPPSDPAAPSPPAQAAPRPAPAPAAAPAPTPTPTPAPTMAPAEAAAVQRCRTGKHPTFRLHPQRRFRCFPDPVRGGFFCGEPVKEGEFSDPGACERACRSSGDACPSGGAPGAACQRCVAACAQARSVECVPGNRGALVDEGCRLEAGAWGAPDSRVVPVSCPAAAPGG